VILATEFTYRSPGQSHPKHPLNPKTLAFIRCGFGGEYWIENPCVGGSIPPRATTESQNPSVYSLGFFRFRALCGRSCTKRCKTLDQSVFTAI